MDKDLQADILKAIELQGAASEDNRQKSNIVLGSRNNINSILRTSSGSPRIREPKKFQLLLSRPSALAALHPAEIRCVMCRSVISYPCWYYNIKYAVNHFHYFVCFDSESPESVTCKCYKRS